MAGLTVTIRISDLEPFKQFITDIKEVANSTFDMHAKDALEKAVERFGENCAD